MTEIETSNTIRSKLKQVQLHDAFAHHPNCSQYSSHVITLGSWRLCLGCTSMYLAFIVMFPVDFLLLPFFVQPVIRLILGLVLFIPALLQLEFGTSSKPLKSSLRFLLGVSLWFLLTAIYYFDVVPLQILFFFLFLTGVILYTRLRPDLIECDSCQFDQHFSTCLIKFQRYLAIDHLERLESEDELVQLIMDLKRRARVDDSILLPVTTT